MTTNISRCPHVATIGSIGVQDYQIATQEGKCLICQHSGPQLWLCLREECLFVGCGSGKDKNDHSGDHEKERAHPLQFNLTTRRIWCYNCNEEVYLNNDPPFELTFLDNDENLISPSKCSTIVKNDCSTSITNSVQVNVVHIVEQNSHPINQSRSRSHQYLKSFEPTLFEFEHSDPANSTRGTSGLYNLGNTCYMNSALQALSNCVPLTSYFLDCSKFISESSHRRIPSSSHGKLNGKLVKYYLKFIETMWIKSEGRVMNPSAIAAEVRAINPSFRSYTQQDAQEFLRCFMDELHSEMRIVESTLDEKRRSESSSSSSTMSSEPGLLLSNPTLESEYETCSSGLSSSAEDNHLLRHETSMTYSSLNEIEQYSKRKNHRRKCSSLSRTDSGVSFNISKPTEADYSKLTVERIVAPIATKAKPSHSHSIISSIFDGRIQSQIECLTCNRRSTTVETFQDLSLPIPSREQLEKFHAVNDESSSMSKQQVLDENDKSWMSWFYSMFKNLWTFNLWGPPLTLQDCLQAFFQADELTGDNMYSCEKCGKLRNGMKYCRVRQLPEVLCIHLKRFRHDSMVYTKIGSYVSFPLVDLDMNPFVHKDCASQIRTYDLFSCIVHYGRAGAGHYTTYALNSLNQHWYEYDDESVRQVDSVTVQSADAYVLFYRKKEPNITDTYESIRHLLSTEQNCLLPFYISRSWINRLFYLAEPGPISNNDFLCKHGGVLPHYWSVINDLVYPAPESVWQLLHEKYGGSPVCNILYPCRKCQLEAENLKRRQRLEKNTFLALKQSKSDTERVFALSPTWYRDWENFVCEKSSEPPGPISNAGISTTKNGVTRLLRRDCNHLQVNEAIWNFFLSTYGGGPELLIRSNIPPSPLNDDQTTSSDVSPASKPPVTFV